jgi:MoxR-like ATPase
MTHCRMTRQCVSSTEPSSSRKEADSVDATELAGRARCVLDAVETAIVGKNDVVELALAVLLSNGHLLIEDIPGVGKTTLAKALAHALGLTFKRIQFTPDLLPADITGSSIYNQKAGEFEVRPGPVFANIVLADEINRTTPKTQSALLECMEERQVTIDGVGHTLPTPFFVIATQNNIELSGTYPLPEAQLDRFAARLTIGYPERDAEMRILREQRNVRPVDTIAPVTNDKEILMMQSAVRSIHVDDGIQTYILDITSATRTLPAVSLGASPRGSLNLLYACQARAALQGRSYVTPDDVKALAAVVLAHRIIVRPEQRIRGVTPESCVQDVLNHTPVPVGLRL